MAFTVNYVPFIKNVTGSLKYNIYITIKAKSLKTNLFKLHIMQIITKTLGQ